ncbi:hypothetical protein ACLOJK_012494 [Asimina triloba]
METGRPARSDVHSSLEEEQRREEETRAYFEKQAPKRHTKPRRSDYSSQYKDACDPKAPIPEVVKFQELECDSQKLVYTGNEAPEEYVETEYYKDLNDVGQQHHTTGTGFIKMENGNGSCFSLTKDSDTAHHASCGGNPATNEWIPSADTVIPISDKPKRSDN